MNKHKVFVYGTLRRSQKATHRLPGYMMFAVAGKHFDFPVIQEYPWDDQQPQVVGNILEVDDAELEELDRYENVGSGLYKRVHALAFGISGVSDGIPVQVYVGGPALLHKPIPSGEWKIKEN